MRARRPRPIVLPAAVAALLAPLASSALAQGCAMCASALNEGPLGQAFNTSILFMMAAPYAIAGAVGGWLFYKHRVARTSRRAPVVDLDPSGRRALHPAAAGPTGGDVP